MRLVIHRRPLVPFDWHKWYNWYNWYKWDPILWEVPLQPLVLVCPKAHWDPNKWEIPLH